jgi:poly-beta-1,6-N-acetyl-D-glucosamine biosynthesis protein PgaD
VSFLSTLGVFSFAYPFLMAWYWILGALLFGMIRRGVPPPWEPPPLDVYPLVSILVPCHNETDQLDETLSALSAVQYPSYEVIAIDDGSTDDTWAKLVEAAARYPWLRIIRLTTNQGKSVALNTGAALARSDFLVCIDGDAMLGPFAVHWLMWAFARNGRIGAISGNPRIRNRSTLLGRLQVGEFTSIVGLIKRAQTLYGVIFTVSGVICAFRRRALMEVGFWAPEALTDDVDVTLRIQLADWRAVYEPRALCWILMPETLLGLWRQRLRWSEEARRPFSARCAACRGGARFAFCPCCRLRGERGLVLLVLLACGAARRVDLRTRVVRRPPDRRPGELVGRDPDLHLPASGPAERLPRQICRGRAARLALLRHLVSAGVLGGPGAHGRRRRSARFAQASRKARDLAQPRSRRPMTPRRAIPPLIETATPPRIRLRDWILTLAAWIGCAFFVREELVLIWDFFRPPMFHFTTALPSWRMLLRIVLRHQLGLEILALWLLCWGMSFSLQHRAVGRRAATPPPVPRAELAAAVGVPEATLSAMEEIKILEVDIGEGGRIAAVRAWLPPVAVA